MNPASLTAVADLLGKVAPALPSTQRVTITNTLGAPTVEAFAAFASHKSAVKRTALIIGRQPDETGTGWVLWHGPVALRIEWSTDPLITGGEAA